MECIVSADRDTWNGAIGKDEDCTDGIHMLLDLGRNTLLVELVLLKATSIGQPRRVKDANLGKRLAIITMPTDSGAYHDAILARKFVNAGGVGLALVGRTTLLVGTVENVEVVTSSVIPGKNIGN